MNTPRKDIHNSNVQKLCQSCEVRHKGMCGALNANELVDFAQFTRVVKVFAGDVLLQEQGPIESYANVMCGVLKLTKMVANRSSDFNSGPISSDDVIKTRAPSGSSPFGC